MVRSVTPGGIVFVTYTNWLSPWGGTRRPRGTTSGGNGPLAGIDTATANRRSLLYGVNLFNLSISRVLGWARTCPDVDVLDAFPRYYPHWTRPLVRIPGLREVATWNLALVLRRRVDRAHPGAHRNL